MSISLGCLLAYISEYDMTKKSTDFKTNFST